VALTVDSAERAWVLDVPIDLARPDELLRRVTGWARAGSPQRRVMYVNAHVLNTAARDAGLRRALEEADLVYADGYGVRLAARALDRPVPHRMTGADWIWDLAGLAAAAGQSMYLLGSEPGVAARAAGQLRARVPALDVAGAHHGYFEVGSPHDDRVVEEINRHKPSILLVGMGSPKQERWVQRNASRVDAGVVWTVGALFDYVSGRVPRAPAMMADNGLEWMFRLAVEPQRMWRRYLLGNPVFVHRVLVRRRSLS
jgi:N-acetylglucosaminyldiphosphoundecaprenol N-acetyl-beta-D-mannosaminyltransferase